MPAVILWFLFKCELSSVSESLLYDKCGGCLCIFTTGNEDSIIGLFFNIHFKGLWIGARVERANPFAAWTNFEAPSPLPELESCSFLLRFFRKKTWTIPKAISISKYKTSSCKAGKHLSHLVSPSQCRRESPWPHPQGRSCKCLNSKAVWRTGAWGQAELFHSLTSWLCDPEPDIWLP